MSEISRSNGRRLWFAALLALLAAVWLAMLLLGTGTLDRQLGEALYAGGRPALVSAAKIATHVGEPTTLVLLGLLVAAVIWVRRQRALALSLTLVLLIGRSLVEAQKYGVERVRPSIEPHLVSVNTYSFVSGHAGNSMIVFLALALALAPEGRWRAACVAAALVGTLLVGVSRVMLGVHWPSDVIGGWAFGAMWVLLMLRPAERLLESRFQTLKRNSITSPS